VPTAQDIIARLDELHREFDATIAPLSSEQEIRHAQAQFLGKKGAVSQLMRDMGKLEPTERKRVGEAFNKVKDAISAAVERKLGQLDQAAREADLARTVDVTLPGRAPRVGHVHLLSQVREQVVGIFGELGFEVAEGPQIETDFHNFEALAIPKDHPARDDADTFYITDDIVLRTHTSPVQVRTMLAQEPPVKIVAPGLVYRRDDDATHSPMFTQLEGLLVDEHVRLSDLKGVLEHFVRRFFGRDDLVVRFRPSYFQFVEPGVEVDMQCSFCGGKGCRLCKHSGWIEIGGAGMVDPEVFRHVDYDSERWTGFAFGMGLERMAMLRNNVGDIKYYYEGDLRFLRQF
jgi:phenylalanyl-tRNA synthetase alpha chain